MVTPDQGADAPWSGGPICINMSPLRISDRRYPCPLLDAAPERRRDHLLLSKAIWGGWYDHVAPQVLGENCAKWGCGYVYGFRVPTIVISPYARPAYISHGTHDFGSIL